MTFSLLGFDPASGRIGGIVSSSSPAVAARCLRVRAGVGAATSQNVTDPRLGPRLLDLLASGRSPQEALDAVVAEAPDVEYRQLAVVDVHGRAAVWSGAETLGVYASAAGEGALAAGNLLAGEGVPAAMVEAFAGAGAAGAPLGDRLVAALRAGLDAGGEAGPVHSAGLLIAHRVEWPVDDLRVDWADDPVGELAALWERWKPQSDGYVQRALEPAAAPSYGVPGDE
jgi:uncharacterized Ntn-hydrolase superfamily protein